MNNREVIEQVERGYRMAQPSTITYPESKTLPSEVKIAQANVYKVCIECPIKKLRGKEKYNRYGIFFLKRRFSFHEIF